MLFHVTHTHGYETCMAHDETSKAKFMQTISNAEESGVKVLGVYADPPGHQIFMVIETETMEQLVKFIDPVLSKNSTTNRFFLLTPSSCFFFTKPII